MTVAAESRAGAQGGWAANRRRLLFDIVPLATTAGAVVAGALAVAIYLGSNRLQQFDAALVGYAVATVFLAFGATYRLVLWASNPPAARYLTRGWRAALSPRTLRRDPTLLPRTIGSTLLFQRFIRARGRGRWLAHQSLFWGVLLAAATTFPLTFGWIHFQLAQGTSHTYAMYVVGARVFSFNALGWVGWLMFHNLDIAAVLVLAGSGYFLLQRLGKRRIASLQRPLRDLLPLVALATISVTGLALTASSALLHGRFYHPLALAHMASVVLTLLFIPFGKFFHAFHRAASVSVPVYKAVTVAEGKDAPCDVCGKPVGPAAFVGDLQATMGDLGLRFAGWVHTCPACKRVARGAAYRAQVKAGYQ